MLGNWLGTTWRSLEYNSWKHYCNYYYYHSYSYNQESVQEGPATVIQQQAEPTHIYTIPQQAESTQIWHLSEPIQESPAHSATKPSRICAYLQHTAANLIVRSFTRLEYRSRSALLTVFKNKQILFVFTIKHGMLHRHRLTKLSGSVQEHLAHCATTASYTYLHHIAQI